MKKLFIGLLILSSCSTHKYVVSVDDGNLTCLKTNEIDSVKAMVSNYVNVDSVLRKSDYFEYNTEVVRIYFEKKN